MDQNMVKYVYVPYDPEAHQNNNTTQGLLQMSQNPQSLYIAGNSPQIIQNSYEQRSTSATLFLYSIINMALQLLQASFLAGQMNESKSNLTQKITTMIFTAFLIKLGFSLVTIFSSAFFDHKSYFKVFRMLAIILLICSIVASGTLLVLSYSWTIQYTGLDLVYLWYVFYMSIAEILLYIPFAITLFGSS
ncbi:unnamed protein product [Moneuplotes crassus]|uniref:Uncharacterized protein n=2 Tax=Euplotes crassus TaxID=5936 RepID=A0AAD1XZ97_EUPCR|nr:unnamed protein product [Moneuplotes crassus]